MRDLLVARVDPATAEAAAAAAAAADAAADAADTAASPSYTSERPQWDLRPVAPSPTAGGGGGFGSGGAPSKLRVREHPPSVARTTADGYNSSFVVKRSVRSS